LGLTASASAPGRAGIIGNPTDIYGGRVLSCSVPARATCRLTLGDDEQLPEDRRLWDAAIGRFPLPAKAKVEWSTQIPRSSGISGSTALLASTMACVLRLTGNEPDLSSPGGLIAFAELVRDIERNDAGIVCGFQDAYMIAHGGLQFMNFAGKHPVNRGPFGSLTSIDSPLPFLLITTGVERLSGSVHGPMAQRWLDGEDLVVNSMAAITELADAGVDAVRRGDWVSLGKAMDENHRLIAELGGSGEPIDLLISRCKSHGAISAKLAGAGLGGTVIALTEDSEALEAGLRNDGYTRFMKPIAGPGVRYESAPKRAVPL
jgi:galactokinase/mevalonate kinase-like predicted kinase